MQSNPPTNVGSRVGCANGFMFAHAVWYPRGHKNVPTLPGLAFDAPSLRETFSLMTIDAMISTRGWSGLAQLAAAIDD